MRPKSPSSNPTDEQRAVVESPERRLTVTASAGAGKTRVLVDRYLRHVIEEGIAPDRILTITFTRKAAAEMKSRIVAGLRLRGCLEAAQIAETGPIQTIHSFCERLLRENAVEAGIDSAFEVLAEEQSSRLIGLAIRDALASSLDELPLAERLVTRLAGMGSYGRSRSPYARLESAVQSILVTLRGSRSQVDELMEMHRDPGRLREAIESAILAGQPPEVLSKLDDGPDLMSRLQVAWKAAGEPVPAWLRGKWDEEIEREALEDTCGLVQLACEAWWRLNWNMEEAQRFDFTELERRGIDLLKRSQEVQDRVRARYRVVMVDEAQDLNRIQYDLLSDLGCERELVVGDAQQSIYGFRLADVDQFRMRAASGASQLTKNWRTDEGILRFVDMFFGPIWKGYAPMAHRPAFDLESLAVADCTGVEIWEHPNGEMSPVSKFVRQLLDEKCEPRDIAVLTRDGFGAGEVQRSLRSAGIDSRISGGSEKFYTRMEVRDLANALVACSDPFEDFSLLACLRSPMVGLSLDSIVLLADKRPVFEALKEFAPPIDEDVEKLARFLAWFDPLRLYADRLSAWEVLSKILAESGYLEAIALRRNSAQLIANVRKLLALAAQEPELGPAEFAERIRAIQEIRHKEGDAPVHEDDGSMVTIMTIHKAKGLEFPIVVLPQTNKKLLSGGPEVLADPWVGMVATNFGRGASLFYRFLDEKRKERTKQEELRILYVAMTRAENRLCISLYPATSPETVSRKIRSAIREAKPEGLRYRTIETVRKTENP